MKPKLKFGWLDIGLSAMLAVLLLLVNLWIYIVAPARRVEKEETYEGAATYTAAPGPAYTATPSGVCETSPAPTSRPVLSDTELEQMLQGVWLSPPTQENKNLLILCFHGAVIGQSWAVPLVEGADYERRQEEQWEGDGWEWFDFEIDGGSLIVGGEAMGIELLSQETLQLDFGDDMSVTLYRDSRGEVGLDAFLLGGWVSREEIMDDGRHQALYFYPNGDPLLHRARSNGADFDSWDEWEVSDVISAHGYETTGWEVMTHLMDGERVELSVELQDANTILAANTDGSNPTVFLRVLSVQALPGIS